MVIGSNTHVHLELLAAKAIISAKSLLLVRSSPTLPFCSITYSLTFLPRSPALPKLLPLHQLVTRLSDGRCFTRPVAQLQLASSVCPTPLSAKKCEFSIIWLNCSISNRPSLAPSATPSSLYSCVFPLKLGTVSTLTFSATHATAFSPTSGPEVPPSSSNLTRPSIDIQACRSFVVSSTMKRDCFLTSSGHSVSSSGMVPHWAILSIFPT
ncbi:hypothetical protein IG631_14361 [Alternaria alternata]|nr:hypothetical protein IG631_14361 [Alternaria alternata]